ncbi:hypothetical protein WG926_24105 [Tistrella sp. BH-R2-4]|uniref:Fibronectin type-III domain-containing protein n=1 Tax=Tistrella arctica TaxID=3133430 RepID=A0ABU9YRG9_9PROT
MTTLSSTPAAPVITSVTCTTGGTLPVFQVIWQPQQGYTGPFVIVVTKSDGTAVAGTGSSLSANGGTWTATDTMNATTDTYYLQVAVSGNEGIISDKVQLLFASPTNVATAFDGALLTVTWTNAASATPTSQTEILLMTPAGIQAVQVTSSGFGQMVVAPNLRSSGGDWSVTLTPQFGICSGPATDPAVVYAGAPAVTAVAVTAVGSPLTLAITAGGSGITGTSPSFVATLLQNGAAIASTAPIAGTDAGGGSYTLTASFAVTVDLAFDYQVALAQSSATAGTATGPQGIGMGLILVAPETVVSSLAANYVITAIIAPPAGNWGATGSAIKMYKPDGSDGGSYSGLGMTRSGSLIGVTGGDAYTLTAAITRGSSTGPFTSKTPLLTNIYGMGQTAVDGQILTTAWPIVADTGLTGNQVTVTAGDTVVATAIFPTPTASGSLEIPALPPGMAGTVLQLSARSVGNNTSGPPAAAVSVINQAPVVAASSFSTTATGLQVSIQAVSQTVDAYTVELWRDGAMVVSVSGAAPTISIPGANFTTAGLYAVRARATAASPVVQGPWSPFAGVTYVAASGLTTSYDGATLSAGWDAVDGAQAYRLVLLEGGAESGTAWIVSGTNSTKALTFDAAKSYSLAVQPIVGGCTGPAATAAVFQAGIYPQFAVDTAPAVIPATQPSMAPYAIAIGLPPIFTSPPAAADLPSVAPFVLTEGTAPYAYTLTIDGTAGALPWSFTADAVRADLYTAYGTFLADLETLGATAIGLQTVQMAISRTMPQTYVETLLYAYGFTGGNGWVDLRPGMVLRAEYESYQTMGSAVPDQGYLNGFITSAVANYQISRSAANATGITTLDAFIGWLVAQGGTAVTQPPTANRKQAGGGGLIDGGYPQMQQPFLRLVYPPSFPSTAQTGTPYPEFNALLLAAAKLSDLTTATANIRSGRDAGANVGVLYFRGRTTLVPQIRVWVNGVEQLVPVGTTANEILAERGMEPSSAGLPLTGISLLRGVGPAPAGSPASYDAGTANPVRLDWAPSANAGIAALPLLNGDRITLGTINGGGGVA